jgi:hypothetical protein
MKKKVRNCEINLGYYKQGDDFGFYLNENKGDFKKAIEDHAIMLEGAARQLRELSKLSETNPILSMSADTHRIELEIEDGPEVKKALKICLIHDSGIEE